MDKANGKTKNTRAAESIFFCKRIFCNYIWGFSDGKTILYQGHDTGSIPVSNGLSYKISRDLKKRGFKYVGAITIYSHLQACGIINDHDKDCLCYHRINSAHPTIVKRRDHEAQ